MTANPDNRGNGLNLGYFPFGDHPPGISPKALECGGTAKIQSS
jgi:hypothetical protein